VIRGVWVLVHLILATFVFGMTAIVASLLRVRGRLYARLTREWAAAVTWASGTPVHVHGAEGIDWSRPCVLVSNHVSGYDIFALASILPLPFRFVAKKELERIPFFGLAWKAAGHISIDRSNRQKAVESLRKAGEQIRREGGVVIIFVEGTRSRSAQLLPFKKGAFALAIEAGVAVLPTVVTGTRGIHPSGRLFIRPQPIHVHFGEPIATADLRHAEAERLMQETRGVMLRMLHEGGEPQEELIRTA
jgi:1-acyl-sn-glycerol-3-phosphate acyltransferase